jgi:hypothetical protein
MHINLPMRRDKHVRQREWARWRLQLKIRQLLEIDSASRKPSPISLPRSSFLMTPLTDEQDEKAVPRRFNSWARTRREHIEARQREAA